MAELLQRMRAGSAWRAAAAKSVEAEGPLLRRALETAPVPPLRLDGRGFDLIAEIKRRSPSSGTLAGSEEIPAAERARAYAAGGAAAISVLTEPHAFGGSLDDVTAVARVVDVPVMRKDFLVDPYQVLEARAAGAAGVLLVLRMLDDSRVTEMLDAASRVGTFVLLEAFDATDLERAHAAYETALRLGVDAPVGINARNLVTLEVDTDRFGRFRDRFPRGATRVAESGLDRPDDARRLAALGYRAALVGSALMRTEDPERFVAQTLDAGREEVRTCASE